MIGRRLRHENPVLDSVRAHAQMRELVDHDVVNERGCAITIRELKRTTPSGEQLPQRCRWSRTSTVDGATPRSGATAAPGSEAAPAARARYQRRNALSIAACRRGPDRARGA